MTKEELRSDALEHSPPCISTSRLPWAVCEGALLSTEYSRSWTHSYLFQFSLEWDDWTLTIVSWHTKKWLL